MIDPRPYTYEYRKPRVNNPTFQSSSVYQSLYHLRVPSKNEMIFSQPKQIIYERKIKAQNQQIPRNQYNPEMYVSRGNKFSPTQQGNQRQISRQQSLNQRQPKQQQPYSRGQSLQKDLTQRLNNQPIRYDRSYDSKGVQSHLSNYGQNLMKSQNFDRFAIFEKQQKGYNIINCYPKQMANSLRVFPKYTLENKLIQSGRYYK